LVQKMNKLVLKSRAEYYTPEELFDYEDMREVTLDEFPLVYIGLRGTGKTFRVRNAILNSIREKGMCVQMYIFRKNQVLEKMNPFNLAPEEEWRKWEQYKHLKRKIDKNPSVVVYDDIHYLCDSVLEGKTDVSVLINLFNKIRTTDGKAILLTDSMLGRYAEQIGSDEFNELILDYGDYSHTYMRERIKKEGREALKLKDKAIRIKNKSIYFHKGLSDQALYKLIKKAGKDIDKFGWMFLRKMNATPRGVVNFVSLFEEDNITLNRIVEKAITMISSSDLLKNEAVRCITKLRERKMSNKTQSILLEIQKAKKIFDTFSYFQKYIEDFSERYPKITKHMMSNKHPYMKFYNVDIKTFFALATPWDVMERYASFLEQLRKSKATYYPSTNLYKGWKGNFKPAYDFLMKKNERVREIIWKDLEAYMSESFFDVLEGVFYEQFAESSYLEIMVQTAMNTTLEDK